MYNNTTETSLTQAQIQVIDETLQNQATKIKELDRRQRKRCSDTLYHKNAVEGKDYIVCPISGVRFTKIRKPHITKTLQLTEEQYYGMFPEMKGKVADSLSENISGGLKEYAYDDSGNPLLDENGKHMTKFESSHDKAMKTLNEVDPETGKRRYDMLGEKTRDTHLNKKDEYGRNGYQQIASDAIVSGNETKSDKYGYRSGYEVSEYDRYGNIIDYFTYKCDRLLYTNGSEIKTRRQGGENVQQVDHLYTVRDGYDSGISPICISMPENTQIISAKANEEKQDASSISKSKLFDLTGYTETQSNYEYELFLSIIYDHMKKGYHNTANNILVEILKDLRKYKKNEFSNTIKFIEYMIDKDNYRYKYT